VRSRLAASNDAELVSRQLYVQYMAVSFSDSITLAYIIHKADQILIKMAKPSASGKEMAHIFESGQEVAVLQRSAFDCISRS